MTTGNSVSTSIVVSNSAPVLASAAITPAFPVEGDTLTCAPGVTSDADGTTSFTYGYGWTVNGGAVASTTSTLSAGYFGRGDQVVCAVTPTDGTDAGATVDSPSVTVENTVPVVALVTLTPTSAYTDDMLTATVTATDADADTLTYTYTWFVNGSAISATGSTLSGSKFTRDQAVYVIVSASDGTDSSAAISSNTVTILNSSPSIASASISPSPAYASSALTCSTGGYADADGDAEATTFAWTINGSSAGSGSTLSSGYAYGNVVGCTATPFDGTASGTARTASVTIANTAPVLASVALTPTTAYEGNTLTCTPGTATDADGTTTFTYTYAWTVNGTAVSATTSTLSSSAFGRGDTVACKVSAFDGASSSSAVTSNTVTISNSAPVTTTVSLTPTTAYEASTLTCAGTAADADGDTVSHSYAWYVNGSAVAATSATLTGTYFSKGNTVYCAATPNDGLTSGTAVNSSTVTISNTAPVTSSVSLTPASPTEASTLTCAATSSDADGDTVTASYAWYVNSTLVAPTTSTLSGTYFARGNTVYCKATPSDGSLAGTAVSSSTVTIANTAPVVSSVTLSPTTAYEASTLTCAPTATDADGDSLTYAYAWYVNSSLVSPTTSTLTGTYFGKGNSVYCSATPSDGTATGGAVSSNTVTISNSAPSVTAVALSPASAYEGSTLTCTPTASDADGDALSYTYAWYVNSSAIAPTTTTLTGTYFSKGNTVYCKVTPSDGTVSGTATSSSTVTISNSAPGAPTVLIDPTDPEAGLDALVCSLDTASTDADGDTLTYAFTWTKNGSAYTGDTDTSTTSTVPASGTTAADVFICSATPSDGSASGTAGTKSVTVLSASYTIGYYSAFTTPGTGSAGGSYSLGQQITVSSAVSLYQLGFRLRLADADSIRFALYTNSSGAPGTLVAYTTLTSMGSMAVGANELDVVGAPVSVAAGTYWIMWNSSGTFYAGYTTTGASSNTLYYNSLSSSSAFPTTWGTGSTFTGQFLNLYMVVR